MKVGKKQWMSPEAKQYENLTESLRKAQRGMADIGSERWFEDAARWFWQGRGDKDQKLAGMKY